MLAVFLRRGGFRTYTPVLVYATVFATAFSAPGVLANALKPYMGGVSEYAVSSGCYVPLNIPAYAGSLVHSLGVFNAAVLSIIVVVSVINVSMRSRVMAEETRFLASVLARSGAPVYIHIILLAVSSVYYSIIAFSLYVLIHSFINYVLAAMASTPFIPLAVGPGVLVILPLYVALLHVPIYLCLRG